MYAVFWALLFTQTIDSSNAMAGQCNVSGQCDLSGLKAGAEAALAKGDHESVVTHLEAIRSRKSSLDFAGDEARVLAGSRICLGQTQQAVKELTEARGQLLRASHSMNTGDMDGARSRP